MANLAIELIEQWWQRNADVGEPVDLITFMMSTELYGEETDSTMLDIIAAKFNVILTRESYISDFRR